MSKYIIALSIFGVVLVLIMVVPYIGRLIFENNVKYEVQTLFSEVDNNSEIVELKDIEELPDNVQRWLEYSGVVGQEKIVSVMGKQIAEMRLAKDKPWMKVEAEQYFIQ